MPVYPGRRDGTWRITVFANGKQHEEVFPKGDARATKGEARKREAAMRLEWAAKASATHVEPTFQTLVDDHYAPHAELHIPSTWSKCRQYQVANMKACFGSVKLSKLAAHIVAYTKREKGRGVAASTINNDLQSLRAILNWAKRKGLLDMVPDVDSLPTNGRRRVHYWTTAEVGRLYDASAHLSPWMLSMLHYMFDTGCRKGEVIAAEWSWVDWSAKMLRIPCTEYWHPKDKDAREVPLSDGLLATLAKLDQSSRTIFVNRFGAPYQQFPWRTFTKLVEGAALRGTPHTTRHTFASHFLAAVPDLRLLADVMGHSSTRVTELYAHMLPDHLAKARGAVNLSPPSKSGGNSGETSEGPETSED